MFCQKCGAQVKDVEQVCSQCGTILQPVEAGAAPERIPNYLAQSILVTLLCCLPLGIPAIVFAAQVNGKIQAGDVTGARDASRKAKMWCWWAFGIGMVLLLLRVVIAAATLAEGR
jgi:hypothetical protein